MNILLSYKKNYSLKCTLYNNTKIRTIYVTLKYEKNVLYQN